MFYHDLMKELDYDNDKYTVSKYDLMKSCIYTVLCVLNSKAKPELKDDNYLGPIYDELVNEYGNSIANGIFVYLKYGSNNGVGKIHIMPMFFHIIVVWKIHNR